MSFRTKTAVAFVLILLTFILLVFALDEADASCQTHKCWHKVHVHRVERLIQHRIDVITPYQCGPVQSVKPCWVINQESSMCHYWLALNGCKYDPNRVPCITQACGLYQFLGWNVPWPVIVVGNKLLTLKRKLMHHRQADSMSLSNW